jgi:hypothetical protein
MVGLSLLWFSHTKCRAFHPALVLLLTSAFFSINNQTMSIWNFLCCNIENRAKREMWFGSSDILFSTVRRWSRLTWFHNFTSHSRMASHPKITTVFGEQLLKIEMGKFLCILQAPLWQRRISCHLSNCWPIRRKHLNYSLRRNFTCKQILGTKCLI